MLLQSAQTRAQDAVPAQSLVPAPVRRLPACPSLLRHQAYACATRCEHALLKPFPAPECRQERSRSARQTGGCTSTPQTAAWRAQGQPPHHTRCISRQFCIRASLSVCSSRAWFSLQTRRRIFKGAGGNECIAFPLIVGAKPQCSAYIKADNAICKTEAKGPTCAKESSNKCNRHWLHTLARRLCCWSRRACEQRPVTAIVSAPADADLVRHVLHVMCLTCFQQGRRSV